MSKKLSKSERIYTTFQFEKYNIIVFRIMNNNHEA